VKNTFLSGGDFFVCSWNALRIAVQRVFGECHIVYRLVTRYGAGPSRAGYEGAIRRFICGPCWNILTWPSGMQSDGRQSIYAD